MYQIHCILLVFWCCDVTGTTINSYPQNFEIVGSVGKAENFRYKMSNPITKTYNEGDELDLLCKPLHAKNVLVYWVYQHPKSKEFLFHGSKSETDDESQRIRLKLYNFDKNSRLACVNQQRSSENITIVLQMEQCRNASSSKWIFSNSINKIKQFLSEITSASIWNYFKWVPNNTINSLPDPDQTYFNVSIEEVALNKPVHKTCKHLQGSRSYLVSEYQTAVTITNISKQFELTNENCEVLLYCMYMTFEKENDQTRVSNRTLNNFTILTLENETTDVGFPTTSMTTSPTTSINTSLTTPLVTSTLSKLTTSLGTVDADATSTEPVITSVTTSTSQSENIGTSSTPPPPPPSLKLVLVIVIPIVAVIIAGVVCYAVYKVKKRKRVQEERANHSPAPIYASPQAQPIYAELELAMRQRNVVRVTEQTPYAQVIGVLAPNQ